MLYYLIKAKSTSSARRTTSLLTRLITFTLETGLLCAVVNVISFILFLSSRSTLMFVVPLATTSKLYSNCMLAMFNSRIRIVGGRDTAAVEELFISTFNFGSSTGTKSSKNYLHTPADSHPGIRIEMTRITDADVHDDSDVLVMDSSKIQRFKPDDYSFAENQRGGEVHE
ncbi:hypothetical protein EUX98_g3577 [Antrodiella citrinella]|uniref:DUF6534 domain-containing protein n=1 Tax=Antrodiella citrinella TaxID=2447956 RepID=A0A4S4MYX7_9APHY|nr:hypothetical protein EUX98_g3577 [Antrodiella citrinella]